MKQQIKIGIVEDELLIAEKIKNILHEIGYEVLEPVGNYDEALAMINNEHPDLVLIDINLGGQKDGIDIAHQINDRFHLPFIFLTANSDIGTIERAKVVNPYAYLVKPYTKEELFVAIEIAFNNFKSNRITPSVKTNTKTTFTFIREQNRFIKIVFDSIIYVESLQNYVVIHTKDNNKSTIRSTFNEFLSQLPTDKFYRTHRSYAIHIDYIENIEFSEVVVAGQKVPMSRTYQQELYNLLGIKH